MNLKPKRVIAWRHEQAHKSAALSIRRINPRLVLEPAMYLQYVVIFPWMRIRRISISDNKRKNRIKGSLNGLYLRTLTRHIRPRVMAEASISGDQLAVGSPLTASMISPHIRLACAATLFGSTATIVCSSKCDVPVSRCRNKKHVPDSDSLQSLVIINEI